MERVRDIYAVAHNWANRIGESAKASNLFFEDENIYSYGRHFLIAKHVVNTRGERAVLFTQRTYSRSTSAHVTIVRNASNHLDKLSVPDPDLSKEELFEKWYGEIRNVADSLEDTRKPKKYILEIGRLFDEAKRYADFFGYEVPEVLVKAGEIENSEQYHDLLQQERELRKAQEQRSQAEALRLQKTRLKDWRKFKINYLSTADGFDYLRFNKADQSVETTQKVEFSLAAGRQLYGLVLATLEKGGCTNCGETFLGRYNITEINDKFIRVGCHRVSLTEIKSFAKKQGW
ncbi:hypothetical protein KXD93_06895 [Mucilaginibacter sp. BJC16-A38]|uniref:hypothetical protein n=1 Tax=Mucilaginibacter phenanthrenivorans TaxID=1234842 RepID=UPI0021579BBC|nr:hypothetical protein [Mucilaginibacter phenanthrenivorans]MCR8557361.1 hypothetical protein [Mucilaginibacter phenanthrenivorans]